MIQIENEQKLVKTLIDTRLDYNTISQNLFEQLEGVALQSTNAILRSFIAHTTKPKGTCD